MEKIWIIALVIFLITLFIYWRLTSGRTIEEYGTKGWKRGETRLVYWQFGIYSSVGITVLLLFLLKWINVLSF